MISTTVRPGSGSSVAPQSSSKKPRVGRRRRPGDSRGRPSGSGRRRRPPARCSGRAAGAGPVPGRPTWPVRAGPGRSGSGRCRCRGRAARSPMPQKIIAASARRVQPRDLAERLGVDAADRRHRLGREVARRCSRELVEALGEPLRRTAGRTALPSMIVVDQGVEQRDVGARPERQHVRWRGGCSAWPRGSMTISLAPRLAAFLMKVAATGWLTVGLAPMTTITSASRARRERRRHGARADRLHQRGDATRRGRAACSGRRCCCRSRCAPASGTGTPPRSTPWPSRSRPARLPPSRSRMRVRPAAATSSASSQVASRKCVHGLAGSTSVVGVLRARRPCGSAASSAGRGWWT